MKTYLWEVKYYVGNRELRVYITANTLVQATRKAAEELPQGNHESSVVQRLSITRDKEINA